MDLTANADLRDHVVRRLAAFDVIASPVEAHRQAAVALALVATEDGSAGTIICRRGRVGSHRGQLGLPGGAVDHGESPEAAALRELEEEVGLQGEVLGRLDDYVTRSGFHISPFVVWCVGRVPRVTSPTEIVGFTVVPLGELLREDSPRWLDISESDRPVLQLPLLHSSIHAPTAAYLYQFAEVVLRGRPTRVDTVEEPVFAWR